MRKQGNMCLLFQFTAHTVVCVLTLEARNLKHLWHMDIHKESSEIRHGFLVHLNVHFVQTRHTGGAGAENPNCVDTAKVRKGISTKKGAFLIDTYLEWVRVRVGIRYIFLVILKK